MNNCNNWFYLCLALLGLILILVAMFMGYNLKLDRRTVKLEKKNGKELAEIAKLKQRINHLENFTGNADISSQSEVYQPKKPELKKDHDQR